MEHRSHTSRRRSFGIALLIAALGLGSVLIPAAAAMAAEADVVVPGSIALTNQSSASSNTVGDRMRMTFDYDTTGKTVHAGDTFTITLPSSLDGYQGSFALKDQSTGAVAANCTTSSAAGSVASVTTCTFTDYVETHSGTKGSGFFEAKAVQSTTDTSVQVGVVSGTATVALPYGKGISPQGPANVPTEISKGGDFTSTKQDEIVWYIHIPGAKLAGLTTATIVDPLTAGTSFERAKAAVTVVANADYGTGAARPLSEGSDYTLTQAGQTLTWSLNGPFDANSFYEIVVPVTLDDPDAPTGTVFANTASVNGVEVSHSLTREVNGGGTGSGNQPGGVTVQKTLAGDGAATVPNATRYLVDAVITEPGAAPRTQQLTLEAGGPMQGISGLPAGTTIDLSEEQPSAVDGVSWALPRFSSTDSGVKVGTDGATATVTIAANHTAALGLTNTATLDPVDTTPAPSPSTGSGETPNSGGDTPSSIRPASASSSLAYTGVSDAIPLGLAAVVLLAAGSLALLLHRRHQARSSSGAAEADAGNSSR